MGLGDPGGGTHGLSSCSIPPHRHAQGERPREELNYQPAGAAGWVAVPLDRLGPVAVDLDASGAEQLQRRPGLQLLLGLTLAAQQHLGGQP